MNASNASKQVIHFRTTIMADHHLGHTRYSVNSQILFCRIQYLWLCVYILQEEPYSKLYTKAYLPMMICCQNMMATMWYLTRFGTFANPAQYGKTSHPTISLLWQSGKRYGPLQTFDPFLQFSGLTVWKVGNLHCLGFDWPTTWVFSKLHLFLENTWRRCNIKYNII